MKSFVFLMPLLAAAQSVPSGVTFEKDVVYSPGSRLMMNVARPAKAGPHPVVVAIHGPDYVGGTRPDMDAWVLKLAQRGYVAATIDYRVAPRTQFPAALQDVKAAIRFLRVNAQKFELDPDRIAVLGEAAGGNLALLTGLTTGVAEFEAGANRDQSSRVSCVVSLFASDPASSSSPATAQFLGGDTQNSPAAYRMASPVNWVTPQAPPVLAMVRDEPSATDARRLIEQLKQVGGFAELQVTKDAAVDDKVFDFLDTHLGMKPAQRVVLVADHGARGQIVAMEWPSGRELWTVPNRNGHDVQPLPDGHVLYTLGNDRKVVEMDAEHKPVWTYGLEEGLQHPISAQRLANGNTLIGDAQIGKVIEVDKDRKIVWKYESEDLGRMRMRNSRRTASGTTLIAVEAAGKIIEVNAAGEIVWTYTAEGGPKRRPYKGIRLPNGNTLITMTEPGELVEVTPAGKIVRSIGGEKNDLRMIWTSGFDLFPDGNLFLSDYQGRRIMEIDKSGKVVHEVRMPSRNTASIAVVP